MPNDLFTAHVLAKEIDRRQRAEPLKLPASRWQRWQAFVYRISAKLLG